MAQRDATLKKTSEEKKDIIGEGLAGYRQGQGAG
jgi:hypothetical protein